MLCLASLAHAILGVSGSYRLGPLVKVWLFTSATWWWSLERKDETRGKIAPDQKVHNIW